MKNQRVVVASIIACLLGCLQRKFAIGPPRH
jgi:hypothetical protein